MLVRLILLAVGLVCSGFIFADDKVDAKPEQKPGPFTLSTSAFLDEGVLPVLYTCDGKDISPQVGWANPPQKTKSFAVVMSDPLASNGTFYHWVLFNVPTKIAEIPQGMEKPMSGAMFGKNDFGKEQYNGPCPPKGGAHTYIFTVYALDATLPLKHGATAKEVLAAMQKHIVGQNKLTAVYSRWIQ